MTIVFRITRSQQMALIDVLVAYARSNEPQLFADCSSAEEVTTSTGDLLQLVSTMQELEETRPALSKPTLVRRHRHGHHELED